MVRVSELLLTMFSCNYNHELTCSHVTHALKCSSRQFSCEILFLDFLSNLLANVPKNIVEYIIKNSVTCTKVKLMYFHVQGAIFFSITTTHTSTKKKSSLSIEELSFVFQAMFLPCRRSMTPEARCQ